MNTIIDGGFRRIIGEFIIFKLLIVISRFYLPSFFDIVIINTAHVFINSISSTVLVKLRSSFRNMYAIKGRQKLKMYDIQNTTSTYRLEAKEVGWG